MCKIRVYRQENVRGAAGGTPVALFALPWRPGRKKKRGRWQGRWTLSLIAVLLFSLFGATFLRASDDPPPKIAKYGFAPLFSILEIRSPACRDFQAVGPFIFYKSSKEEEAFGLRPLFSKTRDKEKGNIRWDVLYPLSRFQSGEKNQNYFIFFYRSDSRKRKGEKWFYLFPLFWGKTAKGQTYGGVFPFYGHLVHRFQKDDIRFVLWPLYARSEKDGFVKTSYPWPFLTRYSGRRGEGFRFWPLFGHEVKKGVYQKDYILWPFFMHTKLDLDKNPVERWWFFPFYGKRERRPYYFQTDFLWPVFRSIRNEEFHYTRHDAWPIFTRAHGDYDDWTRVFPFYVHEIRPNYEKRTVLWPLLRRKHFWEGETEVDRTYFMIFSQVRKERNPDKPWWIKRQNIWPLFNDAQTRRGRSWAVPDPIPVIFEGYRRNWRPLWTVAGGYRRGRVRRSQFLWGLYDHVQAGDAALTDIAGLVQWEHEGDSVYRFSLLQGLIKYENMQGHASLRFFFLPWRLRWIATGGIEWSEEGSWDLR